MVQGVDALNFDPTGFATGNEPYQHQMYDTLVRVDIHDNPTPALAESWKWDQAGTTLTLNLRRGARFHTGREITAADIKFTFDRHMDPAVGANLRSNLNAAVRDVVVLNAQTVAFLFKQPAPGFFDTLSVFYIQNKDVIDQIKTKGAGSGPFMLAEWQPGNMFRLQRNPAYWQVGAPLLDQIVVNVVGDPEAQVAMLLAGQADVIKRFSGVLAPRLQNNPDLTIIRAALGASTSYVMMNVGRKPFDNKRIREAIAFAIDRNTITTTAYPYGEGVPAAQPWPPESWAYDAKVAALVKFDLAQAKRLLAEAGMSSGFRTSMNVSVPDYAPGSKDAAQVLQSTLKQLGVDAEIRVYEANEARKRIFDSDFDMLLHQYTGALTDPGYNISSHTFGPGVNPQDSFSRFTSPEYAKLVLQAGSALDRSKRRALYSQLDRVIIDEAFVNPTVFRYVLFGTRKRVQGFATDLSGYPYLVGTWLNG